MTAHEAAQRVLAAAVKASHHGLTALPYSRFDPDVSTWWLSPSTENPAYKYGKIIFTLRDATPANMLVELYMEKGIGSTAAEPYKPSPKGRRYVMDQSWTWHPFLKALGSGAIEPLMGQIEAECGRPITVAMDGVNVTPPSDDGKEVHNLPRDVVRWEWSGGALGLLDEHLKEGVLKGIGKAKTLPELAASIAKLNNLDWVWIDFHVGFRFSTASAVPQRKSWGPDEVWKKVCSPWRSWLK
jgi:hypothetical protein